MTRKTKTNNEPKVMEDAASVQDVVNETAPIWELPITEENMSVFNAAYNSGFKKAAQDTETKSLLKASAEAMAAMFKDVKDWKNYNMNAPQSGTLSNTHIPIYNYAKDLCGMMASPVYSEIKEFCEGLDDSKMKRSFSVVDKAASNADGETVFRTKTQTKAQWQAWRGTQFTNNRHILTGLSRVVAEKTYDSEMTKVLNALWRLQHGKLAPASCDKLSSTVQLINKFRSQGFTFKHETE